MKYIHHSFFQIENCSFSKITIVAMTQPPRRPRLVMCNYWFHCFGGKRVWKATYDRHKIEAERHACINENILNERRRHDSPTINDVPDVEEMHGGDETNNFVDDIIARLANDIRNDFENDVADEEEGDVPQDVASNLGDDVARDSMDDTTNNKMDDVGGDSIDVMARDEGIDQSFNAIRHAFIKMQSDWDSFGCSISCQDSMMRYLFDGLNPKGLQDDVPKFGAIFRHMAEDWKGELDEGQVVKSWKNLMKMYRNSGMVDPRRYRMCIGSTEENIHDAIILEPSVEDTYEGNDVVNCTCNPPKMKRDCDIHAEMCIMCNTMRKNMIPIDYLPIRSQLQNIMHSKLYSEKMLSLWKNKDCWMGKSVDDVSASTKDFWDGEKLRIY